MADETMHDVIPDCTELFAIVDDEPEKCFPTLHLTALSFIGSDGKPEFSYHIRGERRLQMTLGLLEMVKAAIIRDAYDDDEDD
jgi:hypothetical protein